MGNSDVPVGQYTQKILAYYALDEEALAAAGVITLSLIHIFKGARFRKGHIVQPEDIPVLLSIGKENLYVWEKRPGILHEDEAEMCIRDRLVTS